MVKNVNGAGHKCLFFFDVVEMLLDAPKPQRGGDSIISATVALVILGVA